MICCVGETGNYVQTKDYLTLLAEVERLTDRNEILDLQLTAAVQEYQKARVTVYEQGAALAAIAKEPSEAPLRSAQDRQLARMRDIARAALASAQPK